MALCPRSCSMVDRRYWAPVFVIIIIFQTVVIFLLNDYTLPFDKFNRNNNVRNFELGNHTAVSDSRPEVSAMYRSQEFQALFLKFIQKSLERDSGLVNRSHVFNNSKLMPSSLYHPEEFQALFLKFIQKSLERDSGLVFNNSKLLLSSLYHPEDCQCGLHFKVNPEQALAFPSPKQSTKKFLTIGIPTIQRPGNKGNYLTTTVTSLLSNMKPEQRNDVILVIMAADTDKAKREWVLKELQDNFHKEIKSGNIHVIKAPLEYYNSFKVTKLTHGHSRQKAEWRSKQNVDYAYQMKYSAPLSHYYMQLEDDVIAADDYVSKIQDFIKKSERKKWICLEFSLLGFIGKLYRTEHLERLAQVMLMFFQEHPGDSLYDYFNVLMVQKDKFVPPRTLFQHRGKVSSLPGKNQLLEDTLFDRKREFKGDNPNATIFTTLKLVPFSSKEGPYKPLGFFWSDDNPRSNDNYVVVFDSPQPVERIVIITGYVNGLDKLSSGSVVVSSSWTKGPPARCEKSTVVGTFADGRVDVKDVNKKVQFDVKCIEVKIRPQNNWLLIWEVDVFVSKKS